MALESGARKVDVSFEISWSFMSHLFPYLFPSGLSIALTCTLLRSNRRQKGRLHYTEQSYPAIRILRRHQEEKAHEVRNARSGSSSAAQGPAPDGSSFLTMPSFSSLGVVASAGRPRILSARMLRQGVHSPRGDAQEFGGATPPWLHTPTLAPASRCASHAASCFPLWGDHH